MRITMKPSKWAKKRNAFHPDHTQVDWDEAQPFFVNPRGVLAHRPKAVTTHGIYGEATHCSVEYWCGNQACFDLEMCEDVLVADPGERLLCVHCEAKATAAKEKPADKLARRHVHLGVLRPHKLCCRDEDNN